MKLIQTCIVINERLCAPFLRLKPVNETVKLGQEKKVRSKHQI